jgi:hypothetical protein
MLQVNEEQTTNLMLRIVQVRTRSTEQRLEPSQIIPLLQRFFPFKPSDVVGIHISKQGTGPGVWFRLNDGTVFDMMGLPTDRDLKLYEHDSE